MQQKLNEAGATPRRTYEQARDEFTAAQKESARVAELWRQADNRTYALADQAKEALAALEAANKQGETARATLNGAEIHAPVSGMVVARAGSIGQKTGPVDGKGVFEIAVDPTLLRAVFDADAATAPRIHAGTPILLSIPELPLAPMPAAVTALNATHAEVNFTSPAPAIRPGMPCSVSVQLK